MRTTHATQAMIAARRNRRHSGYSLMEIAMVLAIIALLIAGVMLFFSNASSAQKTNDAMAELAAVQQVTRSLYAGQSDYTSLTTALIANSKQLPAKWVKGTALTSPFSSAVTLGVGTNNTAGDSFTVTYAGLPDTACNKMVTMDMGTAMLKVTAGSTTVSARAMTPSEANTGCTVTSNNETVVWQFN